MTPARPSRPAKRTRRTRRFLPGTDDYETFELPDFEDWMTGQK